MKKKGRNTIEEFTKLPNFHSIRDQKIRIEKLPPTGTNSQSQNVRNLGERDKQCSV